MSKTVLIDLKDNVKSFLLMEWGLKKRLESRNFYGTVDRIVDVVEKDGILHYADTSYSIRMGKQCYYLHRRERSGFTFDGKNIKMWFGKSLNTLDIKPLLEYKKIDWLKEDSILLTYMTKTVLAKVLSGKITNPISYLKSCLQVSRIKAAPALVWRAVRDYGIEKFEIARYAGVAKDVNHLLKYLIHKEQRKFTIDLMNNLLQEAQLLERKIDFSWSDRRMFEEHKKWTLEIMDAEILEMEDEKISFPEIDYPACFIPLMYKEQIYTEGKIMLHCIYTAFWQYIKQGKYIAFHVTLNGEEATLGLFKKGNKYIWDQLYSFGNSSVSEELEYFCKEWFRNLPQVDENVRDYCNVQLPF